MDPDIELVHLRRQNQLFKTLVAAQHRLMVEIREQCGYQLVDSLQRTIAQHIKVQEGALRCDFETLHQQGGGGDSKVTSSAPSVSKETVVDNANRCAKKLQSVTCSLLNIWYKDMNDKIQQQQHRALAALLEFDSSPSEDALQDALSLCRSLSETPLLEMGNDWNPPRGPRGNPFDVDDELFRLYVDTIYDAFMVALGDADGELPTPPPPQPPRPTAMMKTFAKPNLLEKTATPSTSVSPPAPPQPPVLINNNNSNYSANPFAPPPTSKLYQNSNNVPPLSLGHQTPVSQSRRSSSQATGNRNDSSRMRGLLFGVDGTTNEGGGGGVTPPYMVAETPLPTPTNYGGGGGASSQLQTLRETLNRLEYQLQSSILAKDNGSEAKHYALSKRIQKVRAEIIKEERETMEVNKAQLEANDLMMQRKEWQRQKEVDLQQARRGNSVVRGSVAGSRFR
eukprot:PhF_6_TR25673/c0_g1_i1/m.36168